MEEINYTCSLGSFCHSSQLLKKNNLKLCSYPFDWIFSNYEMIIHCIEDNFNIFLDKSYYIDISQNQCGHSIYNKMMFNHHNPLINIDHYNYYVRCVDRFNNLLKKDEHKLFIMIYVFNDKINDEIKNEIIDFNTKFSKYTSNYTLLVILNVYNQSERHHVFTYNDNIHFLELYTKSYSNGVEFEKDDSIYLDNILTTTYNFNVKN
jgi:hypothetical protein